MKRIKRSRWIREPLCTGDVRFYWKFGCAACLVDMTKVQMNNMNIHEDLRKEIYREGRA